MEAKLRVMPRCWYLLLKHFIRVDGVVVMCRETRLFHKFLNATTGKAGGSDGTMRPDIVVFMDVVWRKYSFESTQSADTNISIPVASGALSTASIRPPPAPTVPGLHSAVPNHAAAAASLASKLMSPQGKAIAHLIPVTQITSKEDWSKCEMERGSTIHYAIHL